MSEDKDTLDEGKQKKVNMEKRVNMEKSKVGTKKNLKT